MLLKAAPSLEEPPFSTTKPGKQNLFHLAKLILRRPQNRTEAERGSFVLVEKEFGMRVTVLIVLIALVRADALPGRI